MTCGDWNEKDFSYYDCHVFLKFLIYFRVQYALHVEKRIVEIFIIIYGLLISNNGS